MADRPTKVAVVTRGHPFERAPFFAVFDALDGIDWRHVEHPDAQTYIADRPDADVFVFYDMPGLEFTGADPPVRFHEPPESYVRALDSLFDRGAGFVFLHHAIAGWPTWEGYAEIVGGRFHYQPAVLRGVAYPDSGYRHDVTHTIEVVDPDHPICAGLPPTFEITDEVYCCPVFEDSVTPLFRSRHDFDASGFYSADHAVRGRRYDNEGWTHPTGSSLVGWTRRQDNSPVAYLQFGDGPQTYADPTFRKILANAIEWAAHDSSGGAG